MEIISTLLRKKPSARTKIESQASPNDRCILNSLPLSFKLKFILGVDHQFLFYRLWKRPEILST
jgi:hypothetical protein